MRNKCSLTSLIVMTFHTQEKLCEVSGSGIGVAENSSFVAFCDMKIGSYQRSKRSLCLCPQG